MDSFLSNIFPWMGHQQKLARAAALASNLEAAEGHQQKVSPVIPLSMTVDTMAVVEMDDVSDCHHRNSSRMGPLVSTPEMSSTASRKRHRRLHTATTTPTLIGHTAAVAKAHHLQQHQQMTPVVVVTPCHSDADDDSTTLRPQKMFRGTAHYKLRLVVLDDSTENRDSTAAARREDAKRTKTLSETPLDLLPEDIMALTLSFVSDVSDRFALQCTSKQFHRITRTPMMMKHVNVGGDPVTGKNGIILETDTKDTAAQRLVPYAASGNLEAIYMLGIIKSYCDCDVENGINLLKMASSQGFVRASYALGLVLRDTAPKEAYYYMSYAADRKYLPALQELLPADDMKARYGEPSAEELRGHLDHLCLNRLLSRNYLLSSNLRSVNTSHCWNNLCGRWAYKASTATSRHHHHPPNETVRQLPASTLQPPPQHRRITRNMSRNSSSSSSTSHESNALVEAQKSRVSRMKMCSRCCRAKYCSKLCQIYDWRSGRHKMECQFL